MAESPLGPVHMIGPDEEEGNVVLLAILRSGRKNSGLELKAAARKAGCSFGWLRQVESGYSTPSLKLAVQLCKVYGLSYRFQPDSMPVDLVIGEQPFLFRSRYKTGLRKHSTVEHTAQQIVDLLTEIRDLLSKEQP